MTKLDPLGQRKFLSFPHKQCPGEKPISSRAGHGSDMGGRKNVGFKREGTYLAKVVSYVDMLIPRTGFFGAQKVHPKRRLLLKGFKQLFMVAWCGNNRCKPSRGAGASHGAGVRQFSAWKILLNLCRIPLDPRSFLGLYRFIWFSDQDFMNVPHQWPLPHPSINRNIRHILKVGPPSPKASRTHNSYLNFAGMSYSHSFAATTKAQKM